MQNICRTCLAPITGKISFSINETVCLNDSQESVSVKKMIKNCVPEMALDMIQEAVVCNDCLVTLSSSYKFKQTCLKNEKKLQDFVGSSTKNLNFAIIFKNEEVETTVDINTPNLHTCNICEKTFMSENFLKKHMKTHENNYKYECGVCGKIFNEPVRLKVHILTHEETEQQDTISQDEKDYDESVSSKVAPFMLATNQIHDSIEGKFEVVSVAENKEESFKLETRKIWTDEETLQFLNLCKHHIKDMYQGPKKSLWALIAKKLGAKNIQVTLDQCESKWKNLIRTYNLVKAKLARDPQAQTKFHYLLEFHELMSLLNKVKPRQFQEDKNIYGLFKSIVDLDDDGDVIIVGYTKRTGDGDENEGFEFEIQPEEDNEEPETEETSKVWNTEETLALLDEIKQNKKHITNEENFAFWTTIAENLRRYNFKVTHEQCERKWKTLKRAHRNLKSRLMFNKNLSMTKFSYYNQVEDILKEEAHYKVNLDSLQRLLETSIDEDDYSNELKSTAAKRPKLEEVLSDDS